MFSYKMSHFYEEIRIPERDLWSTLFERKDKLFPDDQGEMIFSSPLV